MRGLSGCCCCCCWHHPLSDCKRAALSQRITRAGPTPDTATRVSQLHAQSVFQHEHTNAPAEPANGGDPGLIVPASLELVNIQHWLLQPLMLLLLIRLLLALLLQLQQPGTTRLAVLRRHLLLPKLKEAVGRRQQQVALVCGAGCGVKRPRLDQLLGDT